jgi:hypothetical protein
MSRAILRLFGKLVVEGGDYTPAGVEKAFLTFCSSLEEKEVKKTLIPDDGNFVKTTLKDAIECAKTPILIKVKKNAYGNLESEDVPGLLFKEDEGESGKERPYAYGIQDGPHVAPLNMNMLLVCYANGFRYDGKCTVESATITSDVNRIN